MEDPSTSQNWYIDRFNLRENHFYVDFFEIHIDIGPLIQKNPNETRMVGHAQIQLFICDKKNLPKHMNKLYTYTITTINQFQNPITNNIPLP